MRIGVLLPSPWFNIQIEMNWYTYDDSSRSIPDFITSEDDVKRESLSVSIQFPIVFGHYDN